MKRKIKSILCAAVASIEVMGACSAGTLLTYAADHEIESKATDLPPAEAGMDIFSDIEEIPEATTAAPEETTEEAPEVTTAAPEQPTEEDPEATTAAPEETTEEAPEATTAAPEETTEEAPEATTAAPEQPTEEATEVKGSFKADTLTEPAETERPARAITEGWNKDSEGRLYYYKNNNGKLEAVTGVYTIKGQPYLFADNGVLKTGWRTINNKRYYFDHTTGEALYGWLEYEGKDFHVSKDQGKNTGFFKDEDGLCYLFTAEGSLYDPDQFVNYENNNYYIKSNGTLATGEVMIKDNPYVFAANGVQKTGWRTYEGKRYFYNEKGELQTGLVKYCGNIYYVSKKDGKLSGIIEIDGLEYVFAENTGAMALGWQTINGKRHYYTSEGKALVGVQKIDGDTYFFNEKGEQATGWQTINGELMYFPADGKKMQGWQTIDGAKYYFVSTGKPAVGLVTIEGKLYNFSAEGKMQTGWFNTSNGAKYYFKKDGSAIKGFQKFTDGMHYFLDDGTMAVGWQTIDNKLYYFDEKGVMAVDTKIGEYTIDANGVATKVNVTQQRANNIIASVGSSVINLYNYVKSNNNYKFMEQTRSLQEIESKGWSYFANYAMDNRFVVCYYFAALTDLLFQQAGYETRIVYGTGRGDGEHYWNQVKINGTWTNYDACNGYADVTDDFLKGKNYTWTQYVNAKFE